MDRQTHEKLHLSWGFTKQFSYDRYEDGDLTGDVSAIDHLINSFELQKYFQ